MTEILLTLIAVIAVFALFVYVFRKAPLSHLHAAAAWGKAETVKDLLNGGADSEARTEDALPPCILPPHLATRKPWQPY